MGQEPWLRYISGISIRASRDLSLNRTLRGLPEAFCAGHLPSVYLSFIRDPLQQAFLPAAYKLSIRSRHQSLGSDPLPGRCSLQC